jgi:hypothetical protein
MVLIGAQVDSTDPFIATEEQVETPADGQGDDIAYLRRYVGR